MGLAADCDNPEEGVTKIFAGKLKDARSLPSVAFVTHDSKWVDGFGGAKDTDYFKDFLARAEKTPYLQASPDVRKKIAGLARTAERAAKRQSWRNVVRSWSKAQKLSGRCAERTQLNASMKMARGWADTELAAVIKGVQVGGDIGDANKRIKKLKSTMTGSPYAEDAAKGLKALDVLKKIRAKEKDGKDQDERRDEAIETYAGTRWTGLFGEPEDEESEIDISGS